MVLEEAFPVGASLPFLAVIFQLHQVTAQSVAGRVRVSAVGGIVTLTGKSLPEGAQVGVVLYVDGLVVVQACCPHVIACSAKLRSHLNTDLVCEGEDVLAAELPEEGFLVIECVTGIARLGSVPGLLPLAVGR